MKLLRFSLLLGCVIFCLYFASRVLTAKLISVVGFDVDIRSLTFNPFPTVNGFISYGLLKNINVEATLTNLIPVGFITEASWMGLQVTSQVRYQRGMFESFGSYTWSLPKIFSLKFRGAVLAVNGEFKLALIKDHVFGVVKIDHFVFEAPSSKKIEIEGNCYMSGYPDALWGSWHCELSRSQKASGVWRKEYTDAYLELNPETLEIVSELIPEFMKLPSDHKRVKIRLTKSPDAGVNFEHMVLEY